MYTVSVSREFVASHFLTVPNPGPEGDHHSHAYTVDVRVSGSTLNEYGYLVDIEEVERLVDRVVERYLDETLNELPEFDGANPSLERFARAFCRRFVERASMTEPDRIEVRLWEDDVAWAAYEMAF